MLTESVKSFTQESSKRASKQLLFIVVLRKVLISLSLLNERSSFATVTGAVKSSLYVLFVKGNADLNFEENSAVS